MPRFAQVLRKLSSWHGQDGQTLAEYSLVLALVGIGVAGALTAFAVSLDGLYDSVRYVADVLMGA
ncbi:MAG TPA: hypothetical protein VJB57_00455 [Dehalococcoidia bacterium]|nr:hypothetical protein [Dehalococcoidia bacterium]